MPDKKIIGLEKNVFFTGLVSFFMDFSSEMIYPLVPIFLSSVLGVNKSIIGLIEGIAESTASLLKVFSGWFSDRIGRRKIFMLAGYGISTLSRPIIALSALWGHVLVFRFIDRFGKGIRGAPRDAIIAESTPIKDLGRSFGFHRGMDTLGAVAGPAVAFILLSFFTGNYRLVFWLSIIPGMLAVMVIVFFIREKSQGAKGSRGQVNVPGNRDSNPRILEPLDPRSFDWHFKAFVAIATLFAIGNSSDVFLILKATNTGIEETLIPVIYLCFNLVYALTAMPAGILSDRIGRKRIILAGFILFGFIYWGFANASEQKHIWGLFLLYGVFMGLTEGIQKAYLGTIIPEKFKATG
ncbi:MAG: MFS transporter, partial [Nitrospirae bacterium]|nr:MFS transporter [Nitrospirota bacterium]